MDLESVGRDFVALQTVVPQSVGFQIQLGIPGLFSSPDCSFPECGFSDPESAAVDLVVLQTGRPDCVIAEVLLPRIS